ncbi:MAG: hypothetical protein HXY51_15630 [Nitrospirae bacterium]|nr:hypothetical protein [Nitrospirota bacterium]
MDRHMTAAHSTSVPLHHRFMTRHFVTFVALSLWIGLTVNGSILEAATLPTVDEVMQELHISDSDRASIMQGKIVDWTASEGSDRELALGMAFLVKTKPEDLFDMYREALVLKEVSVITAHGKLKGEGTIAYLAGVKLQPNGEKEAKRYLNASPGDELNLDAKEIAAFQALKAGGDADAVPVEKVEVLVRQQLLARYQAYRSKGLPGIAPYERGRGQQRLAGDELLLSTKQMTGVAKHLPAFHKFLLNYPQGLAKDEAKNLEEFFYWLNIDVFGRPMFVLVHRMLYHTDDAAFAIERHYYTSHDYNSMLQGIAVLPTKDGTFLFYIGRVSTDQVAGFGSAALHPVSRAITSPYIKDMFQQIHTKAGKR